MLILIEVLTSIDHVTLDVNPITLHVGLAAGGAGDTGPLHHVVFTTDLGDSRTGGGLLSTSGKGFCLGAVSLGLQLVIQLIVSLLGPVEVVLLLDQRFLYPGFSALFGDGGGGSPEPEVASTVLSDTLTAVILSTGLQSRPEGGVLLLTEAALQFLPSLHSPDSVRLVEGCASLHKGEVRGMRVG